MLKYAVIFLVISMIAGALGFLNISALARRISLILFGLFLGLALLVLLFFLLLDRVTEQHSLLMLALHWV